MTTNQATHRNPNAKEVARLIPSRALPALLDFWTMCDFIGMRKDRSTRLFAWRGAKNGTFPAPVKLSEARIAWRRDEVERWLAERPRAIYSKAAEPEEAEEAATVSDTRMPVMLKITMTPKSCPMCGGKLDTLAGAVYSCGDSQGLGCNWVACVVAGDAA